MSIHGIKVDSNNKNSKPIKMNKEDKKVHDHALNKAMKRKRMELSRK